MDLIKSINQLEPVLDDWYEKSMEDETLNRMIEQMQETAFNIKLYLGYEREKFHGYVVELDEERMNQDGADVTQLWNRIREIAKKANYVEKEKGVFALDNKKAVDDGANMSSMAMFNILLGGNEMFKKYVTKWIAKNGFYDDEDVLAIRAEINTRK